MTAGNAAGLNDGATACLVAAEEVADELGLPAAMRLVSFAYAGVDPELMGIGPIPATERALRYRRPGDRRHRRLRDQRGVRRPGARLPVIISGSTPTTPGSTRTAAPSRFGHPLASSGVRLMIHLARTFREHPEIRYGLTTMCIGLGMGGTVIWENPHHARREGEAA